MNVFVTVGTHPAQFDRLLKELDLLLEEKKLKGIVFAQSGNSFFVPKNFAVKKFLQPVEMRKKIFEADVVISHGGAGSIIGALEQSKPLVIVPRLKAFGEHTNDHQLDLAGAMEKSGKAIAVFDIGGLFFGIEKALKLKKTKSSGANGIIITLENFFAKSDLNG